MISLICPKCRGRVFEDIESHKYMDLHCVRCSKRWFVPKKRYRDFLNRLEKNAKHTKSKNILH